MGLRRSVERQFGRPTGALGALAGWIMAARPSNRERNRWTVELLDIRPADRVAEIGCGPGLALAECAARATAGEVVGMDHSAVMLAQARRRNRRAIAAGRLRLIPGGPEQLRELGALDRILLINVIQFLVDRHALLAGLHPALAPGGAVAITYQPRHRGATPGDAARMAHEVGGGLREAGFAHVVTHHLALRPVPAVCVIGRRGAAAGENTTLLPPHGPAGSA